MSLEGYRSGRGVREPSTCITPPVALVAIGIVCPDETSGDLWGIKVVAPATKLLRLLVNRISSTVYIDEGIKMAFGPGGCVLVFGGGVAVLLGACAELVFTTMLILAGAARLMGPTPCWLSQLEPICVEVYLATFSQILHSGQNILIM